jgi:hypothetical protein
VKLEMSEYTKYSEVNGAKIVDRIIIVKKCWKKTTISKHGM